MPFIVVYDANALYGNAQRNLLIRIAQSGLVQAKWTDQILDEMLSNLGKKRPDISAEKLGVLRELMNRAGRPVGTRLVVVVDQFEGLVSAAPEVARELDAMLGLITERWPDATRRVQAIVVSRIDFLQQFSAFPHLNEAWKTTNVVVPPMTREQLSEIIISPLADLKGIRFADGLPEQILYDTPTGPSALPMLEYTLTELWKQQERGIITTAAYREIGGVDGALARSAERALWQRADASERPAIERVLIQMVRPGEQLDAGGRAPDTRRVASRDEFDDEEWRLIHRIATTRLVSITRQPTGPDTAELTHAALLTAWPRLAGSRRRLLASRPVAARPRPSGRLHWNRRPPACSGSGPNPSNSPAPDLPLRLTTVPGPRASAGQPYPLVFG